MSSVASIIIKSAFLKRKSYLAKAKPASELSRMENNEPPTATMTVFNIQRAYGKLASNACMFWSVGLLGKKVIGVAKISVFVLKALNIMYRNGTIVSTTSRIKTAFTRTVPTRKRTRLEGAALDTRATGVAVSCCIATFAFAIILSSFSVYTRHRQQGAFVGNIYGTCNIHDIVVIARLLTNASPAKQTDVDEGQDEQDDGHRVGDGAGIAHVEVLEALN